MQFATPGEARYPLRRSREHGGGGGLVASFAYEPGGSQERSFANLRATVLTPVSGGVLLHIPVIGHRASPLICSVRLLRVVEAGVANFAPDCKTELPLPFIPKVCKVREVATNGPKSRCAPHGRRGRFAGRAGKLMDLSWQSNTTSTSRFVIVLTTGR